MFAKIFGIPLAGAGYTSEWWAWVMPYWYIKLFSELLFILTGELLTTFKIKEGL